jgi:hypothetical protein
MRREVLYTAVAIVGSLLAVSAAFYLVQGEAPYPSVSCAALSVNPNALPLQGGLSYICGQETVSDARLNLTLNNYRFADGRLIDWAPPGTSANGSSYGSSGVYLLANITVKNIGSGQTSIGPTLLVSVNNSLGQQIMNSEYGAGAWFPGEYPNASIPAASGGVFLPPGTKVTYWFIFYMPDVTFSDMPNLKLYALALTEFSYGGTWEGNGGFSCTPVPCQSPQTELIVISTS